MQGDRVVRNSFVAVIKTVIGSVVKPLEDSNARAVSAAAATAKTTMQVQRTNKV